MIRTEEKRRLRGGLVPAWRPYKNLVWEAKHGAVPAGMIVVFKLGLNTTVREQITLDRLELISRAEQVRRLSLKHLPKEFADLIRAHWALERAIKKRTAQLEK